MPRVRWAMPVAALTCLSCSAGDRGTLQPLAADGVTLVSTQGLPDDTARLAGGGVVADVTGSWSETNQTVEVAYRAARRAVSVPIAATVSWQGKRSPATAVWDRTAPVPGNVYGRPLLEAGKLVLKAGERRKLVIEFAAPEGTAHPAMDEEIAVAVPMPDGSRSVRFRLGPP